MSGLTMLLNAVESNAVKTNNNIKVLILQLRPSYINKRSATKAKLP